MSRYDINNMEENKNEEVEIPQAEPEPSLENQEENKEGEGEEPIEEPKPEPIQKDTDFDKEIDELENKHSQDEELRRALHARDSIDRRIADLGGEKKPIKIEDSKESPFVTKEDLAEQYASSLAKSDSERKVIMWHYRNSIRKIGNIHEDVDNAYWLAHKGRIRKTYQELERIARPSQGGGGAGQKFPSKPLIPEMPKVQQDRLKRIGFVFNPKTSEWVAKHTKYVYVPSLKGWDSVKI